MCRTAERLRKWHARQGAHKGKGLTGVYISSAGSEVQGASGVGSTGVYIGGCTNNSVGNEQRQGPTGNGHEDSSGNGSGHTSLEQPRQSSQISHEEGGDADSGADLGDDNVADVGPPAVVGASSWSASTSMGTTTATGTTATGVTTAPASSTANLVTLDDPLAFRHYKPKTAAYTIGRFSAKNPHLGVEVFTDLLLPPGTQVCLLALECVSSMTDESDVEWIHNYDDEASTSEKRCSYAYYPAIHASAASEEREWGSAGKQWWNRAATATPSVSAPSRDTTQTCSNKSEEGTIHHSSNSRALPSYFSIWRISLRSVPLPLSLLHATTLRHASLRLSTPSFYWNWNWTRRKRSCILVHLPTLSLPVPVRPTTLWVSAPSTSTFRLPTSTTSAVRIPSSSPALLGADVYFDVVWTQWAATDLCDARIWCSPSPASCCCWPSSSSFCFCPSSYDAYQAESADSAQGHQV